MSSSVLLLLISLSLFVSVFKIPPASASLTIVIKADGNIDPPTAPVTSSDSVTYTLEDNIYDVAVILLRDDIVFNGNNHILQGTGSGIGIKLSDRYNVTIRDVELKDFQYAIDARTATASKIQNSRISGSGIGIYLSYSATNNSIFNNELLENGDSSVRLYLSNNNSLFRNTITSNTMYGIRTESSSYNRIFENTIVACGIHGLWLDKSSYQQVSDNNISGNSGFGVSLTESPRNILIRNKITANSEGVYLFYSSYNQIINNNITNQGNGIRLWFSASHLTIDCNHIAENNYGIYLYAQPTVENNTISKNTIANNTNGLRLSGSDYNTVIKNRITNNTKGIYLSDSHNNDFYHNNFVDNIVQIDCISSVNFYWDNGYEGNYWSDYVTRYINASYDEFGIWDTPYVIDENNQDNYPLRGPYWNPADTNHDLEVDIFDIVLAAVCYCLDWQDHYAHVDVAEPYGIVDIFDIVMIASQYGKKYAPGCPII